MSKSLKITLVIVLVALVAALVAWYWRAHNSGEAPMSPEERQIINSLSVPDATTTASTTSKELQSLSVPKQKSPAAQTEENDILKTLQAK